MTKQIEKSESNTTRYALLMGIIIVGLPLAGVSLGYRKGLNVGRDRILTEIMHCSKKGGALAMRHPKYGQYMFKAIKEIN